MSHDTTSPEFAIVETASNWLYSGVKHAYNYIIRPKLPRKWAVCNGVAVRSAKLLDRSDHLPEAKRSYLDALNSQIQADDHVVEVGAGFGIGTVKAARQLDSGRVSVFEGSIEHADFVREAARANQVSDRVDVTAAVVGPAKDVWGPAADNVAPTELPECDLLLLDCECAEAAIIPALEVRPRAIVVEVHTGLGVPISDIVEELSSMGYEIKDCEETEGSVPGQILTAERELR